MVEASRTAAAGTTTHRSTASKSHSANGDGKRSLGRPANPRRVAEARTHCFRTHGVAISARPTDETVPNLADLLREPHRQLGVHLDDHVVVRAESCRRRRLVLPCRPGPPLCGRYASTPWAVVDWPASHQPTSLGHCFAEPQLRRRTRTRFTSGTDPPRSRAIKTCAGRSPRTTSFAEGTSVRFKRGPYGDPALTSARVGSFGV